MQYLKRWAIFDTRTESIKAKKCRIIGSYDKYDLHVSCWIFIYGEKLAQWPLSLPAESSRDIRDSNTNDQNLQKND